MKKVTVINRTTGKAESWKAENVKSYCDPKNIEKMRKDDKHSMISFIIEFKGLGYGLGMWSVDEYDLVVE